MITLRTHFPSPKTLSRETLVQFVDVQWAVLDRLLGETDADFSDLEAADMARMAIGYGKALQHYVVFDVSAVFPDVSLNEPVVADLMSAANEFMRIGRRIGSRVGGANVRPMGSMRQAAQCAQ